jgi:hypothetical protein
MGCRAKTPRPASKASPRATKPVARSRKAHDALERAAELTFDSRRRGERLVRAAEVAYELGLLDVVRRPLTQAETSDLVPLEAARLGARQIWLAHRVRCASDPSVGFSNRILTPVPHPNRWDGRGERGAGSLSRRSDDSAG